MSNATRFDLTREEIIERYRQRIARGDRTKLLKDELGQLALHFVDRLQQLTSKGDIQTLCQAEIALLEEGYPQSSIGSYLLPVYRRLIGEAIANTSLPLTEQNSHPVSWTKRNTGEQGQSQKHYALTYLKYDQETYALLRQTTTAHNNERQDNLQAVPLNQYLEQAQELLTSSEPETLAIALCALTGRRHTEVVAKGQFECTSYAYTLHFAGQQKDPDTPPFDILTLIPAAEVLSEIERFRALPEVVELAGLGHDAPQIDAFNGRVNRRVEKYFGGVVPVLDGFKSVSIHRLRGVYGAIAIHFFCPEHQHEHRFLQHYLGHLLEEQGRHLPNAAATQHYFHYRLLDSEGKVLVARGIKVMADTLPPTPAEQQVQVSNVVTTTTQLEIEVPTASQPQPVVAQPQLGSRKRGSLRINANDRDRWLALLSKLASECTTQQSKMKALLDWAESHLEADSSTDEVTTLSDDLTPFVEPESLAVEPVTSAVTQAIADQARTLAWLTGEIEALRTQVALLGAERDQAVSNLAAINQHQPEVDHLKTENSRLTEELAQAQAKLNGFRQLLNGNEQSRPVASSQPQPVSVPSNPATSPVSTLTTSATATAQSAPKLPKAGGAKERAMRIFLALQDWNRQHPHDTFALTPGLLEREFGIHRQAAKEFIEENQNLIRDYHQQIRVANERSHNRGKEPTPLKVFVEHASSIAHSLPDVPPSLVPDTASELIEQAVQAIMDYNNYTAAEKDQKWAITSTSVMRLSGCDRASVERFLQEHHLALSDHHTKHELSPDHNDSHSKKNQKIEHLIHL